MSKEIKINPDLFKMSKPKTQKKKLLTGTEIKKALLETIQGKSEDPIINAIQEIETIKEPNKQKEIETGSVLDDYKHKDKTYVVVIRLKDGKTQGAPISIPFEKLTVS